MSTTVDSRVVEMRFDNKQFENNVQTSLSTLDKLKRSLKLDGATKGLNMVSSAASKFDASPMAKGLETVQAKFSALEVIGMTALSNITNSAINAGKNLVSSFTLEPIKTGFEEYELKMGSVQTIMASTGADLETVNKYLQELNTYSDKTIYSFSDMTNNIGKFTNAGVKLEDAVAAIQGVSNEAAVSGANANEASRAMYNFAQALSAGYVKLIDWKSIENANMATVEFKDQLIQTAAAAGTLEQASDGMYKVLTTDANGSSMDAAINATSNFNDSLSYQWMTSEVLIETLKKYADETTDIGKKAYSSAQDVKTFSMMMDTLKEAAQSGWAQTWETIVGDFEEAKTLFTNVSNVLGDMIGKSADSRNAILSGALSSKWDTFIKQVNDAGVTTEAFQEQLKKTAEEHGIVINDLIEKHGSLKNVISKGLIPTEVFTESLDNFSLEGEDAVKAMDKAKEYIVQSGDTLTEIAERYGTTWQELYKMNNDIINDPNLIYPDQIIKLSDAQLKSMGYTKQQITVLRDLAEEAKKTGTPMNNLIESMGKPSGRELLIDSFSNAFKGLQSVIENVSKAWREIFHGNASDDDIIRKKSENIYGIIEALYAMSTRLKMDKDTADNLTRTFKGLFAVLDIISTIANGGLKFAFNVLKEVLGAFDMDILELTANIGDSIVSFRDFIKSNKTATTILEGTASVIVKTIKWIKQMVTAVSELPITQQLLRDVGGAFEFIGSAISGGLGAVDDLLFDFLSKLGDIDSISLDDVINGLKNFGKAVKDVIKNFDGSFSNLPDDFITGFANGILNGAGKAVEAMFILGGKILEGIKEVLGIHSPSTEAESIGIYFMEGFFNGLKTAGDVVLNFLKNFASSIVGTFTEIGIDNLFAGGITIGLITIAKKLYDSLKPVTGVLGSFAEGIEKLSKSFSKVLKAKAFEARAEGVKQLATSILMLVAAVAILTKLDGDKLWNSVLVIGALSGILVALSLATDRMSKASVSIGKDGANIKNMKPSIMAMSTSILLLASAVKLIGTMSPEEAKRGFEGLAVCVIALGTVFAAYGKLVKGKASENISKVGGMMAKLSISLLLMIAAVKLISGLSDAEIERGGAAILGFAGIVAALTSISKLGKGKTLSSIGGMMMKISVAMLLMIAAIKLAAGLSDEEIERGGNVVTGFVGIIGALTLISSIGGKATENLGKTILSISASMILMVAAIKLLSGLSADEIGKGGLAILGFVGIIAIMAKIVQYSGEVPKMAATILAMSVAVGILAAVAVVLGLVDIAALAKGLIAVGLLGAVMTAMIYATKGAADCKGNLIAMTVAVGIMAAAVVALSMIDGSKLAGATAAMSILIGMFAILAKSVDGVNGSIATLVVMTVAVGLLGGIIYLLSGLPVQNVLGVSASLSILLLSMSAACLILSKVGNAAKKAVAGALALDGVIIAIGLLMVGIGALINKFSEIDLVKFLDDGIVVLEKIGLGIGSFFGSIISGFSSGLMSGLPAIADTLSDFMTRIQPFLDGANKIDPSIMDGIGALAGAVLALTAADLVNGIMSFLSGGSSLSDFADQIVPFGTAISRFAKEVAGVDGEQVLAAAKASEALAEMAKELPNSGGLISFFTGDNDMGAFADGLVSFGGALRRYSLAVAGIDTESIEMSSKAAESLAKLAKALPNSGGLVGLFTGNNDMGSFADGLVPFGRALKRYSKAVAGVDASAVELSVSAAGSLAKLAKTLPNSGGLVSLFTGDNDMGSFADGLIPFGSALKRYSDTIAGIDVGSIDSSSSAILTLSNAISRANSVDVSNIGAFVSAVNKLGSVNIDASALSQSASSVSSSVNNMMSSMQSSIASSKSSMTSAMSSTMSGAVSAVTSSTSQFINSTRNILNGMLGAINAYRGSVAAAFASLAATGAQSVNGYYGSMYAAGTYVASGFVSGIRSQISAAVAAAAAMVAATVAEVKADLKINSPSKVFYEIGDFAGQGLVNALSDYKSKAYKAGGNMASAAADGLRKSMGKLSEISNIDLNTEPTIRPVLDLSSIKSGTKRINGLFSDESVGVTANLLSINNAMNRRNQNGTSDQIVSAINKLRKDMSNSGNSYTINGVTYDDGSNIVDAVETIVRAARMERRS